MKEIYVDYAATTPIKQEVQEAMMPYLTTEFGNPSALYNAGARVKEVVQKSRGQIAALIGSKDREIFFTAGGTEADNWAIRGVVKALKGKGNHIITSSIEHHAVLHTCQDLEKDGYKVTYLPVDKDGKISLEDLKEAITEETILITIMLANNEIGTIQPVKEIGEIAKAHKIIFHSDGVQALGNIPVDVKELNVDLLSISGHKIYGPKGIGALYIKQGTKISNFIFGGAQENNRRAGTENVLGIVGFGKAAELAGENLEAYRTKLIGFREHFINRLFAELSDLHLNGHKTDRLPGNANIAFRFVEGELLLSILDIMGVYASTGSACNSATFAASHVIKALKLESDLGVSSLRFTFGHYNTMEEVDYVVDLLVENVKKFRLISPTYIK